jgi:large conductance mechanosensitive channel
VLRDLRSVIGTRSAVELTASIVVALAVFELVRALVSDFVITPLTLAGVEGGHGRPLTFDIGGTYFYYGDALSYGITLVLLTFLLALVISIVRPRLWDEVDTRDCPFCLSEVPAAASVCGACGREISTGG